MKFLTFYTQCTWSLKKVPISGGASPFIWTLIGSALVLHGRRWCLRTCLQSFRSWTTWTTSLGGTFFFKLYNLGIICKLVFTDSWSWQSFVACYDIFNCLFSLDVQNELQLPSRFFCYSWLVYLLGFWLRNAPPIRVIGNHLFQNKL